MARVFWFRRDLRLNDNVALNLAIEAASLESDQTVWPTYVLGLTEYRSLGGIRQHSISESLRALDSSLDGNLTVVQADTEAGKAEFFAQKISTLGAAVVHATRAFDPQGIAEQNAIGLALKAKGIHLQLDDSYYAIKPGTILKGDGTPYRVYTPFFRAWFDQLRTQPQALRAGAKFARFASGVAPEPTKPAPFKVVAGEAFAMRTLARFETRALDRYDELRDRADLSGTSHLSHALAFGEIHPRTILARLRDQSGHNVFRKEIAWREFYADVLWHNPSSLTDYYEPRFARMRYDVGTIADERLKAWQQGKTGFPMVDAGLRQLAATGWMHNRVRMIVASFLVKDLHLEWQQGADWFERHLSDFDPASNSHGWQWTAGSGTDASPYFRVFNPISQGLKFDPNGDYVRKYVPELAHIRGAAVHEPWLLLDGLTHGYPAPIVDHSAEREEALARLAELKTLT
jgi:deoxyribodipyrimidine photo-lyase